MSSNKNSLNIIYENDNFIAINKPVGLLVHPTTEDRKEKEETLIKYVLKQYPQIKKIGDNKNLRPGIVHRLDKNTTGIIVIAKTQKFFDYFKELLKKKKDINKTYIALLWGKIEKEGTVNKPIGLKPGTTKQTVWTDNAKMIKNALTEYKPLKVFKKDEDFYTLAELTPKTGRTHQLRVHMASLHHSIIGDGRYGKTGNPWSISHQLLHAYSLEFNLMDSNKRVKLITNLPEDFLAIFNDLGLTSQGINDILK